MHGYEFPQGPEGLSFRVREALSWAVAGEVLLVARDALLPFYPDTMDMYDNLWLADERGGVAVIMNRLGGHVDEGLPNLWAMAALDPEHAAAELLVRSNLVTAPGMPHRARAAMAFRVAQWLLAEIRDFSGERMPLARSVDCLANYEQLPADVLEAHPVLRELAHRDWVQYHALRVNGRVAAVIDMATGEVHHSSVPGSPAASLPKAALRPDGRPGCPLAYYVKTFGDDGGIFVDGPFKMQDAQWLARHTQGEFGRTVAVPAFALAPGCSLDRVERPVPAMPEPVSAAIAREVVDRIRRPLPGGLGVLEDSLPVVSFGDPSKARVASISLNPSWQEFLDTGQGWLDGDDRRLESRRSLGLGPGDAMSDEDVEATLAGCVNYFSGNPYKKWFTPMGRVLREVTGADYWDGSACHLDLVQWATMPAWAKLSPTTHRRLIEADVEFLHWQMAQMPGATFVLNGATTLSTLQEYGIVPRGLETVIVRNASGKQTITVSVGEAGGQRFVGWNHVVAHWHGADLPGVVARVVRELS